MDDFSNIEHEEAPPANFSERVAGNSITPESAAEEKEIPQSLLKSARTRSLASPIDAESYFNSLRSSRPNSIYSITRASLSNQLSQLTSLHLPNASSLSTSISAIPSAPSAAKAFGNAAEQMGKWLRKAKDVLGGLDAEDDVEWAAAGGRDGLGEVDTAVGSFENLIHVYVKAIEDLQEREDIAEVPPEVLGALVQQMEKILGNWNNVRKLLKGVKSQVELAMEWEELWNVVMGDIGLEMGNLTRLVFEMEEARHKSLVAEPAEATGIDVQELETIVEENDPNGVSSLSHRFSLPPAFSADSPLTSPSFQSTQDDSALLALFARMQPLRASLDFLPMTLANFRSRAEQVLSSACRELEDRRKGLEKKWKTLERDAEVLRRELGEDRWVLVFRNAGRQADKLCESVERSIGKLQEAIDVGSQHNNPTLLAKKVENYEAKKLYYGPAIERVIAIIEKGVKDRLTVNGEVLRLRSGSRARWTGVEAQIKEMDLALEDLNINKSQQLRDSISTIVSMDRSAPGSAIETPGSSPASSVVMGTPNGGKGEVQLYGPNGSSRRSSILSNSTSRPNHSRRMFTLPSASGSSTQLPRKTPISRSFTSDSSRNASPSPYSYHTSSTPTPGARPKRPLLASESKPRWNSSPKIDYNDFSYHSKIPRHPTPPSGRKSSLSRRLQETAVPSSPASPHFPLLTNLDRSPAASSVGSAFSPSIPQQPRLTSGAQTSLGHRQPPSSTPRLENPRSRLSRQTSTSHFETISRRESQLINSPIPLSPASGAEGLTWEEKNPSSSQKSKGRRMSRLPTPSKPTIPVSNGRSTSIGVRTTVSSGGGGRKSSLGGQLVDDKERLR